MGAGSPFGKYAAIIAAIVGALIVLAWLAGQAGFSQATPGLDFAFGVVLGAIFGTGAGAYVMANGLGQQAQAAHTRLDAIHAPAEPQAQRMVDLEQQALEPPPARRPGQ